MKPKRKIPQTPLSTRALEAVMQHFLHLMEMIDSKVPVPEEQVAPTVNIARSELFEFAAFLTDADGHISPEELSLLGALFDCQPTERDMVNYITSYHLGGADFREKTPYSFWRSIQYDNAIAVEEPDAAESLSLSYVSVMRMLGVTLLGCDGRQEESENCNMEAYLQTLADYRGAMLREQGMVCECADFDDIIRRAESAASEKKLD